MVQYPSTIKRPVVDTGKGLLVGFVKSEFEALK
jgi:arsenate reductase-like glutaredoxin family protein